jgi:hypothetical protein
MGGSVLAVRETRPPIMATGRYPADEGWVNRFAVGFRDPECAEGTGTADDTPKGPGNRRCRRYPRRLAA